MDFRGATVGPAAGQKLAKGERTRQLLLSCAIDEIVEKGPDRLGFTSVSRRANVSTGALYARYENCDELLVDAWRSVCLPALTQIVDLFLGCKTDPPSDELRTVVGRALSASSPEIVAAVSLMVAARRNEALHEDLEPSLRDLIDKASVEVPIIPHLLAYVTGAVLYLRSQEMTVTDWAPAVDAMAAMVADVGSMPTAPPEPFSVPMRGGPRMGSASEASDGIDARLLEAVVHVINRTGVDRATVSRIARRANLNPAVIYARHEDKEHLVHGCIKTVIDLGVVRNNKVVESFGTPVNAVDVFPGIFRLNASPESELSRIFQLETTLAAGHDEKLRSMLAGARARAAAAYASVTGVADVFNMPLVWPFVVLNRAMTIGHTLMLNFGYLQVDDPFIEMVSRHIVATMRQGYEMTFNTTWDISSAPPLDGGDVTPTT